MNKETTYMGLFTQPEQQCEDHEFGEWEETDEFKTGKKWYLWNADGRTAGWTRRGDRIPDGHTAVETLSILRKHVRSCENEGCEERDTNWYDYRVIPVGEVQSVGFNPTSFPDEYNQP